VAKKKVFRERHLLQSTHPRAEEKSESSRSRRLQSLLIASLPRFVTSPPSRQMKQNVPAFKATFQGYACFASV